MWDPTLCGGGCLREEDGELGENKNKNKRGQTGVRLDEEEKDFGICF